MLGPPATPPLPLPCFRRPLAALLRLRWFRSRVGCSMESRASEAPLPPAPTFIPAEAASGRGFRFRLVSYNILAQNYEQSSGPDLESHSDFCRRVNLTILAIINEVIEVYVKSSFFPHSPSPCLRWKARSQAILTILKSFGADFLCLQELDEFDSFYKKNMEDHGYSSIYIQRGGRKHDGCGIFYKSSSAELLLQEEIQYNDLVEFVDSGSANDEDKKDEASNFTTSDHTSPEDLPNENRPMGDSRDSNDPRVRLKRDCVGIMAAFRLNGPSYPLVIVANTHIYWDPEWADVKLAQAEYLLLRLSQFRRTVLSNFGCMPPVIVAGDFNSTPGDMVYRFVVSGIASARLIPDSGPLIPLSSLYASVGGEPPFTNCTPDFTGTLDYIFFTKSSNLKPVSFLQIPGYESPEVAGGLPNYYHPSDHLPIGGDFEVNDI